MDAKSIFEQLLDTSRRAADRGKDLTEEAFGVPEEGSDRDAMLTGMTKGALAAGAVALLLGTKGGRKLTGTALKAGSIAAVGGLAFKAYQNWQAQQSGQSSAGAAQSADAVASADVGTPLPQLPDAAANQRSQLLVSAMIAAANADGHIDAGERQIIETKIKELDLDANAASFLLSGLVEPPDVEALARQADSVEASMEIYLVSSMVADASDQRERAYLDELAAALSIDPALAAELERQLV